MEFGMYWADYHCFSSSPPLRQLSAGPSTPTALTTVALQTITPIPSSFPVHGCLELKVVITTNDADKEHSILTPLPWVKPESPTATDLEDIECLGSQTFASALKYQLPFSESQVHPQEMTRLLIKYRINEKELYFHAFITVFNTFLNFYLNKTAKQKFNRLILKLRSTDPEFKDFLDKNSAPKKPNKNADTLPLHGDLLLKKLISIVFLYEEYRDAIPYHSRLHFRSYQKLSQEFPHKQLCSYIQRRSFYRIGIEEPESTIPPFFCTFL